MSVREYGGELSELFSLWLEVAKERPLASKKDKDEFRKNKLETEIGEIQTFLAYEDEDLLGASIIYKREGTNVFDYLVSEEKLEHEFSLALLEKTIEFCSEEKIEKISLYPTLYSSGFRDFFKEKGFKKNEEYPEALWMRRELKDLPKPNDSNEVKVISVQDIEKAGVLEGLVDVNMDFTRYDREKVVSELKKENREKDDILYGVAKKDGEVAGFSRTTFRELLDGQVIAQNVGLIVKEDHRNQGVGTALLVESFHEVKDRGYEEVFISTHSKNPAKRLYKRLAFETIEKQPHLTMEINL